MRLGIDGRSPRARVWNFANRGERIQIEYGDSTRRSAAGNVQPPSVGVGEDVIETAFSADFGGLQQLLRVSI